MHPGPFGTSLPPFPKVTLIPPNLPGLPNLEHLIQQQGSDWESRTVGQCANCMVRKTCLQIPALLPTGYVTLGKLPTSQSLSAVLCKMWGAKSIHLTGLQGGLKDMVWVQC